MDDNINIQVANSGNVRIYTLEEFLTELFKNKDDFIALPGVKIKGVIENKIKELIKKNECVNRNFETI